MPTHIALLRAINVGGRNIIAMAALREMFESLGFANVRTLLQSGNVVFDGERKSAAALEKLLESETEKRFGFAVEYVVRAANEWAGVIDENPFEQAAQDDPSHLVVVFLKNAPDAKSVNDLQAVIKGPEVVRAVGKQLYTVYPDGIGRSKLTIGLIEKTLGTRGTGRNWNTVLKLAAMVAEEN